MTKITQTRAARLPEPHRTSDYPSGKSSRVRRGENVTPRQTGRPESRVPRQDPAESDAGSTTGESACHAWEQAPAFRRDGQGRAVAPGATPRPDRPRVLQGRWCPYCNIDLRAIESASHDIRSLGASLVVVSQQTPDNSLETQRRNELSFASLVDAGGARSRTLSACAGRSPTNCVPSRRAAGPISRPSTAIRAGR
jgi:AhpC/TSA family